MTFTEWKFTLAVLAMDYHSGQFSRGYRLLSYLNPSGFSDSVCAEIRESWGYQSAVEKFAHKL